MLTILKYVNKLFKLPFLRELDGNKEVIACILILFTALDGGILQMLDLMPDVVVLQQIHSGLAWVVTLLGQLGEVLGIPVLAVGALHRRAKEAV